MSAGKLSRFAGSVFVLAAVLGGVGVAVHGAEHETGGSTSITGSTNAQKAGVVSPPPTAASDDITWG